MRAITAIVRLSLVAALVAFGVFAVKANVRPTAPTIETSVFNTNGVAIGGYDTVAYFTDREPVPGSATHAVEWQGTVWHFTSAENALMFRQSPERFAPQYGGHSVYGMSRGKTFETDPRVFDIIADKLYLSRNERVREIWQRNPGGYIGSADEVWADAMWAEDPGQRVN